MDQVKIGRFIAECRKKNNLTQAQLAEMLGITDRAVSKWENGKSMPDSSIMLDLCDILKITVNDLLNGEVIQMEQHDKKQNEQLLELIKQKEQSAKKMLEQEIVISVLAMVILLGACAAVAFLPMSKTAKICLLIPAFLVSLVGLIYALRIEQTAGYYECGACHHKYIPTFGSVFLAPHVNRTRFMKCPCCGKRTWQRKVLNKD